MHIFSKLSNRIASSWQAIEVLSIKGSFASRITWKTVGLILTSDLSMDVLIEDVETPYGTVKLDLLHRPDWRVFRGVFVEGIYNTDYSDSVVIDVGAHRGIYSAYALQSGCRALLAYEPEGTNFRILAKNVEGSLAGPQEASIYENAVAARSGQVRFYVYDESWSHSTERRSDKQLKQDLSVESVAFTTVIDDAVALAVPDSRIIVKIDIEGGEYDLVARTPIESLKNIDELFVETHKNTQGRAGDLMARLREAGLSTAIGYDHDAGIHRLHRYVRTRTDKQP